ncbi:MAG: terminase TerL endonuclease subunit [Gemmataceae bacterium]
MNGWCNINLWQRCQRREDDFFTSLGLQAFTGLEYFNGTGLVSMVHAIRPPLDDGPVLLKSRFWLAEQSVVSCAGIDEATLWQWNHGGHLVIYPGEKISFETVKLRLMSHAKNLRIREVAVDRFFDLNCAVDLDRRGLNVVGFGQGYTSMHQPVLDFESDLQSRRIIHDGNPVLEWCVRNTAIERNSEGRLKPSRRHSAGPIGGAIAAMMALARLRQAQTVTV